MNVGDQTDETCDADGDEGTAFAVDVAEEFGGLALFGEGSECACCTIHGGVADREDGNEDDYVHDAIEPLDSSISDGNDER